MPTAALRYLANCSLLFTEVPLLERPKAARGAGFSAVEFWWPFETARPSGLEVDRFLLSLHRADVRLIGLNYYAGDLFGPDCGLVSIPGRSDDFRYSVDVATSLAEEAGTQIFNALYGNRLPSSTPEEQDAQALVNLQYAADAAATVKGTVVLEAVSGPKPYPLRSAAQAMAVADALISSGRPNVGLLLDLYHLATNGGGGANLLKVLQEYSRMASHVQVADIPGRGEPGSGELEIDRCLDALVSLGYGGWVGLEYRPTTSSTLESLYWLQDSGLLL